MELYDVIVVGAGVAGLACAHKIKENQPKAKVIVLEATDHLGGRCRTVRESEFEQQQQPTSEQGEGMPEAHGNFMHIHRSSHSALTDQTHLGHGSFPFEVGAEFVHGNSTPLGELISKHKDSHKIKLQELFTWAHGDGGPSEHPAPDGGVGVYYLGKEKRLLPYNHNDEDMRKLNTVLWSLAERKDTDSDMRSLLQFLRDEGVSDRVIGMADSGYANTVGGTLEKISVSQMCRCERNWLKDGEEDYRIERPLSLEDVVVGILKKGLTIRRRMPVTKVTKVSHRGYYEVYSPRKQGSIFYGKHVVVTASITVLQKNVITFTPPLPTDKVLAIQSMECEPAYKIMLKFTTPFWPRNLHGAICSDSFAPELWFEHMDSFGYVTAFFTSDQARRVGALPIERCVEECTRQMSDMFSVPIDTVRKNYVGSFSVDWGRVPFIWGGYTMPSMKEMPTARHVLARSEADGTLFFAGEATCPDNFMTAHAAMGSGIRVANEIVTSLTIGRNMLTGGSKL